MGASPNVEKYARKSMTLSAIACLLLGLRVSPIMRPPNAQAQTIETTEIVSVPLPNTGPSQGSDGGLSISENGRYVAFGSHSSTLVSGDTNSSVDVFVRDMLAGTTQRVSVNSNGDQTQPSYPVAVHSGNHEVAISSDGRFVAFQSNASDLVIGDDNNTQDVFVHDRQTGITTRASISSAGVEGNAASGASGLAISQDGRYVAFESLASNLVELDTNDAEDVFVHDTQTGATTRVSRNSAGEQGNSGSGYLGVSISADGRFVAFLSSASNLTADDADHVYDVFVHDRQTGQTVQASLASDGTQPNGQSHVCADGVEISANGRYVVFSSLATNLVTGDTNGISDVFVRDMQTHLTSRVTISSNGDQSNGSLSCAASITADGRYVAFYSYATNLVPNDTNNYPDIFVHDRVTGLTSRASVAADGSEGNTGAEYGVISGNGLHLAFASHSSNLVASGTYIRQEIYRRTLAGYSLNAQPAPFLDLPVSYDGTRAAFNQYVQNHWSLTDGKITSWFDHNYPTGSSPDGKLVIFTGEVLPTADDKRCGFGAYCYDDHNGIDIIGESGSDVLAAGDGIVVRSVSGCENNAGGCVGFGNFVVIQHLLPNTNGYYTLYGHLSAVDVVTGTSVIRGQTVIGKLGSTGNSSGPHIHFGVYRDDGDGVYQTSATDKPVDPFGYVGTNPHSDPWVTTPQTVSYRLWIHDPAVPGSTSGEALTLVGATQNVTATIPANRFPGQATLELTTGPVAGPSAQLRQAGQSFWLTLIEWIQGLDAAPGALPADTAAAADPITVTVQYSADQAQHLDLNQAAIYRWDEATAAWQALPTTLNALTRTLTGLSPDVGQFSPQAPLLCPADTSEPDDDLYRATSLSFGSASAGHVFDSAADDDWFAWEAQAHVPYVIRTQGLAAGVDTVLEIRDASGQNVLATDDNSGGGGASRIERTFAEAGTYFARIVPKAGSATGCASAYQMSVFIPRVFLTGLSR